MLSLILCLQHTVKVATTLIGCFYYTATNATTLTSCFYRTATTLTECFHHTATTLTGCFHHTAATVTECIHHTATTLTECFHHTAATVTECFHHTATNASTLTGCFHHSYKRFNINWLFSPHSYKRFNTNWLFSPQLQTLQRPEAEEAGAEDLAGGGRIHGPLRGIQRHVRHLSQPPAVRKLRHQLVARAQLWRPWHWLGVPGSRRSGGTTRGQGQLRAARAGVWLLESYLVRFWALFP